MIGYLALARDTFDVNYAIDKKNRFERFINSFANDIVKYDRIISNNDIGKAAIVVPTGFITAQSGIDKKISDDTSSQPSTDN